MNYRNYNNLEDIKKEIELTNKHFVIYAPNGTGKTSLCRKMIEEDKKNNPDRREVLYYTDASEDLFSWEDTRKNTNSDYYAKGYGLKIKKYTSLDKHLEHSLLLNTEELGYGILPFKKQSGILEHYYKYFPNNRRKIYLSRDKNREDEELVKYHFTTKYNKDERDKYFLTLMSKDLKILLDKYLNGNICDNLNYKNFLEEKKDEIMDIYVKHHSFLLNEVNSVTEDQFKELVRSGMINLFYYISASNIIIHNPKVNVMRYTNKDVTQEYTPIRLSTGETRIMNWCIFYDLFKKSQQYVKKIIIDDPTNSLDEQNSLITIDLIAELIKEKPNIQFIITSHNTHFIYLLRDKLKKENFYKDKCYGLELYKTPEYKYFIQEIKSTGFFYQHYLFRLGYNKLQKEKNITNNDLTICYFYLRPFYQSLKVLGIDIKSIIISKSKLFKNKTEYKENFENMLHKYSHASSRTYVYRGLSKKDTDILSEVYELIKDYFSIDVC